MTFRSMVDQLSAVVQEAGRLLLNAA